MHKLTFTLKQHTPLIHFQHDQAGATLRATEVKPKLDFFIMKKLLNDPLLPDNEVRNRFREIALKKLPDGSEHERKNWIEGNGDHAALDYKMSIVGQQSTKYVIASRLSNDQRSAINNSFKYIPESSFFAEEKSIGALFDKPQFQGDPPMLKAEYSKLLHNITKQGIFNKDHQIQGNDIRIKIVSFNSDLLREIKNYLIQFFLSENFGCRQNKGFGCFTVNEIENEKQSYNISTSLINIFDYVYCKNSLIDFNESLSEIQKDYKLLKAGRGRQEGYAKSKLFLYFAKKYIRWEKRWIKQKYSLRNTTDFPFNLMVKDGKPKTEPIDINLNNDWDDCKNPNNSKITYQYIRALLGIAEQFEFQTTSSNREKFVVQIGSENNPIQRYKSPITFKYINGNTYLLANKISKDYKTPLGESVEFTFRIKDRQNKLLKTPNITIPNAPLIPSSFDIEDFIDFALSDKTDGATIKGYIKIQKL